MELADDRERAVVADIVVSAVGCSAPRGYPEIEGLADFSGDLMHTAQWDATVDLAGKRVAVVGTGPAACKSYPNSPARQRN